MRYLKGKNALMIFERHANLKYKYGDRHFWREGYYFSTKGVDNGSIECKTIQRPFQLRRRKTPLEWQRETHPQKGLNKEKANASRRWLEI
jgi:hypothetical protein